MKEKIIIYLGWIVAACEAAIGFLSGLKLF